MATWRISDESGRAEYVEAGDELRAAEVARSRGFISPTVRLVPSEDHAASTVNDAVLAELRRTRRAAEKHHTFSIGRVIALLVLIGIIAFALGLFKLLSRY